MCRIAVRKRWAELACLGVGHVVPTTAVLTPSARNKAKALFRSTAPALLRSSGDDSKAAQLRQPLLSRRYLDLDVFRFLTLSETVSSASVGRSGPAFGASPEERNNAGAFSEITL